MARGARPAAARARGPIRELTRALFLRPEAERDIADTALWYEVRRPGLGGRFLVELDHLFARVLEGPQHFPEIGEDVRRGLLRRFPYAVYFIDCGDPSRFSPFFTSVAIQVRGKRV